MKLKQSFLIASSLVLLLGAGCMGTPTAKQPSAKPAGAPEGLVQPSGQGPAKLKPGTYTESTSTGKVKGPPSSKDRSADTATGFQGGPPHIQQK